MPAGSWSRTTPHSSGSCSPLMPGGESLAGRHMLLGGGQMLHPAPPSTAVEGCGLANTKLTESLPSRKQPSQTKPSVLGNRAAWKLLHHGPSHDPHTTKTWGTHKHSASGCWSGLCSDLFPILQGRKLCWDLTLHPSLAHRRCQAHHQTARSPVFHCPCTQLHHSGGGRLLGWAGTASTLTWVRICCSRSSFSWCSNLTCSCCCWSCTC